MVAATRPPVDWQQESDRLRRRFRKHYETSVAFNRTCGVVITRWDPEGVVFEIDYRDDLSAHDGIFHGGVVATLIDTSAGGAVMAGHDFSKGSRLTTVSLAVSYLSVAPGEGIVPRAHCLRRGRRLHYVEAAVEAKDSQKLLATGLVTCNVAGDRPVSD